MYLLCEVFHLLWWPRHDLFGSYLRVGVGISFAPQVHDTCHTMYSNDRYVRVLLEVPSEQNAPAVMNERFSCLQKTHNYSRGSTCVITGASDGYVFCYQTGSRV